MPSAELGRTLLNEKHAATIERHAEFLVKDEIVERLQPGWARWLYRGAR